MKNTDTITHILNQALDCVSKGIMIQDINRQVVFFNHACEEITKWSREDVIGKDCGDIFMCHTSTGMCLTEKFCPGMDVFHGKITKGSRELLIRRGDRTESWVKMSVSPIRDSEGKETHIVSVIEDISDVKKFSDEVIRSKTQSTLGAFAAELAHEVKNPLNAMNIQMTVLEREIQDIRKISGKAKKELIEIVTIVQKELNRLSGFVEECLHFSKTGELNKSNVDVGDILSEIVSLLLPQAQLYGIQIELAIRNELPKVMVDKDKIKQAILNILINGIEAMPDGGKLHVIAERVGHEIWISCQDAGSGIPDEIKDKIFNLFYTTKDGGTGIGLSFAQNIIQAHGGVIRLEASLRGSKFVIAIPIL
ncbi:two-component system, NtrC family, sensor histidine kinase HydH [Candidatus Brocadiaceae bacterium]|nr:two-component system, NtrC family, sensor histidine kinase HydH [Candidatus Brocadiaceae bacterium]